jgi:hypothetical protein
MTRRPGFALVVALLLVVVLAALGAAMLAVGARETEIAAAMARRSEARIAAESVARWAVATWSTRRYDEAPIGSSIEVGTLDRGAPPLATPGREVSASLLRLAPDLFLVEGSARTDGAGPAVLARAGLLVRTFDTAALAAAFPAAATARDSIVIQGGAISGTGGCENITAAAALAPRVSLAAGAAVEGSPDQVMEEPPGYPEPDPFGNALAATLATVTLAGGTVSPRPWLGPDGCQEHPLNWGATSPTNACHDRLPFIRIAGDLEVAGGEARGILLVHGNVRLRGTQLHGLIISDGTVTIDEGTIIQGAVRGSSIEMVGGAVAYDACTLRAALTAAGLDAPIRPGPRQWIPLF